MKLIGPAFSKHTPESFYEYVKSLNKKEKTNDDSSKKPRKTRTKKNAKSGEVTGQSLSPGNELLKPSDNPGVLEESPIPITE